MTIGQDSNTHMEEEYIDIEISSNSDIFCYSISSPPQSREFEFQMASISLGREHTTSPADELFYKGKLLPLHLPRRLQMVQNLLQSPHSSNEQKNYPESAMEESFDIPFIITTSAPPPPSMSPFEPCRVSCDLNPNGYRLVLAAEMRGFIRDQSKKSWSKKLKLFKQSSLGQKLKASRAYLMSLFSKSACSNESCAKAAENVSKKRFNGYTKMESENPFAQISAKLAEKERVEDGVGNHRRSFSGAIQRASATKSASSSTSSSGSSSLSSSFSFSSNGLCDLQFLKRSSSACSERESSIEGAIAHCKQSLQLFGTPVIGAETGICSLSASKILDFEEEKRPEICSV